MPIALSVNLNKIALLRNSREGNYPDVIAHGRQVLEAGVQGLTVHPRPDQRHIRADDVLGLSQLLKAYPNAEFNIEGNPFAPAQPGYPGLIALVEASKPNQCTLVPDTDSQLTSDHGFNLDRDGAKLSPIIEQLHSIGARVSLFMDPDIHQISLAKKMGADRIELYTGPYAANYSEDAHAAKNYQEYYDAAQHAQNIGLGVNAGHDLNLQNLAKFNQIPGLLEVSIGHALTMDALQMGLDAAVAAYLKLCAN